MAKANVTIIEAPMGEGKTLTVTGILVDDYLAHVTGVWSPNGNYFRARSYKGEWIEIFPPDEILEPSKQLVDVHGNILTAQQPLVQHYDVPKSRIIHADPTNGWNIESDTKIFANYHLFGIRSVYCDAAMMLQNLNNTSLSHCKMVIDEAYIQGEARRGMNTLSLMYTWFAQQMRKRDMSYFCLCSTEDLLTGDLDILRKGRYLVDVMTRLM
jgi:hypothetical protein